MKKDPPQRRELLGSKFWGEKTERKKKKENQSLATTPGIPWWRIHPTPRMLHFSFHGGEKGNDRIKKIGSEGYLKKKKRGQKKRFGGGSDNRLRETPRDFGKSLELA